MLDPASPAGALEAADRALESFVYRIRVVAADERAAENSLGMATNAASIDDAALGTLIAARHVPSSMTKEQVAAVNGAEVPRFVRPADDAAIAPTASVRSWKCASRSRPDHAGRADIAWPGICVHNRCRRSRSRAFPAIPRRCQALT
jgi:hypothetical protein